jgi:hypothetical protein
MLKTPKAEKPKRAGMDTHWDFVMKEALWLANDFRNERLRHQANAKKILKMVDQHHKTKDTVKIKQAKVGIA